MLPCPSGHRTSLPPTLTPTPAQAPAIAPPLPLLLSSSLPFPPSALQLTYCSPFAGTLGSGCPSSRPFLSLGWLGFLGYLHRTEDGCGVGYRGTLPLSLEERCDPEVGGHQAPQAAPLDTGCAETSAPNVFETLQCRLSSLEAAVAAWRHRSLSVPRPVDTEDQEAPGSSDDQEEGAGPGQQEAARLKERNAWLRLALGSREDELACTQASLKDAQAEKATLQRQVSWGKRNPVLGFLLL